MEKGKIRRNKKIIKAKIKKRKKNTQGKENKKGIQD